MRLYRSTIVFWMIVGLFALAGFSVLYPAFGEICEYPQYGQQKECSTYSFPLFLALKIAKLLDGMSAAVNAIATVVICVFTYTLWKSSEKMWGVGKLQADLAEMSLTRLQRAFVSVHFLQAPLLNAEGKITHWAVWPVWRNDGSSPARNSLFRHNNLTAFGEDRLPDGWDFPDMQGVGTGPHSLGTIPPRADRAGRPFNVLVEHIEASMRGTMGIYFWGWIEYNDVFSDTDVHVTRFAVHLRVRGDPRMSGANFFYEYLEQNCSDDECAARGMPAGWRPRLEPPPIAPPSNS